MGRFADIYMSSVVNLLDYPIDYSFYVRYVSQDYVRYLGDCHLDVFLRLVIPTVESLALRDEIGIMLDH